jgi:hypothetical protein
MGSRNERPMTRYFPKAAGTARTLPDCCVRMGIVIAGGTPEAATPCSDGSTPGHG